jgi:hypothetical protein
VLRGDVACDKEGERERDGERELLANIINSCLPESGGV